MWGKQTIQNTKEKSRKKCWSKKGKWVGIRGEGEKEATKFYAGANILNVNNKTCAQ